MTSTISGPDFVSFQVRDLDRSASFYEHVVGMSRLPAPNPDAVVFSTGGAFFAVRTPFAGVDLDAITELGAGVGVWFADDDVPALHTRLVGQGVTIMQEPFDGPFGTQLSFRDLDGYVVTVHSTGRVGH